MDPRECDLPHVAPGYLCLPLDEVADLRAAATTVAAAERREAEAAAERRAADARAMRAEERAADAERERTSALATTAAAYEQVATRVAEAIAREREWANANRSDTKSGLVEENRALGGTVTRLLAENEALAKRVAEALNSLNEERKEHARLRASRPDVQMEAARSATELEKARVEASVREKEIESNHDLATMLLSGLGTALLPMSEKLLGRMLEEKFPRTLQAGTDSSAAPAPKAEKAEGGKVPLQVWTELVIECWKALSHTSRMQAAFALAESRWLNVLVVPETHPIFARMRDEIGAEAVTKLVQMTYALTGVSPVAPDTAKPDRPANDTGEEPG